jgi:hypothetical protein
MSCNLDLQMATTPLSHTSRVLPQVVHTVAIPTTVAPTMGHGFSGHRSAARLRSLTGWQFATGVLVTGNSYFYIMPGSYRLAAAAITHAFMLPVGSINIFVSLTYAVDHFDNSAHCAMCTTPLLNQAKYDQARSATLPLSEGGSIDDSTEIIDESEALANDTDPPTFLPVMDLLSRRRLATPSLAPPPTGALRNTLEPYLTWILSPTAVSGRNPSGITSSSWLVVTCCP